MSFDSSRSRSTSGPRPSSPQPKVLAAKRWCIAIGIFAILTTTTSSGLSELGGNDFFVTLGGWRVSGGTRTSRPARSCTARANPGPYHGGDQDERPRTAITSSPITNRRHNYTWQTPAMLLSARPPRPKRRHTPPVGTGYSRKAMNTSTERSRRREAASAAPDQHATHTCPVGPPPFTYVIEGGDIDWNNDLDYDDEGPGRNINRLTNSEPADLDRTQGFRRLAEPGLQLPRQRRLLRWRSPVAADQ